ncbi:MAG: VOC family protein, partial [Thermoleophilia bacterium]|nr:VOC family protein [Thermoleophilia bacterium]
ELRWPEGGGVMLGSAGRCGVHERPPGAALVYLVTADPDAVHRRALGAGGEIVQGLRDEDYGSRGFTARDPEGNLWSFGTYAGSA